MKNDFVKFNVNHHVYVKLKDAGLIAFVEHYNKYVSKESDKLTLTELVKRADEDGYHQMQMHEFMEIFGTHIYIDMNFKYFEPDIYFDKNELHVNPDPKDVKAIEGWEGRSAEDVDLPDGYYEGKWGGYVVNIENIILKGKGSSYKFKTTEGIRCVNCAVKIIVKNKRAYVYDHKTNLHEKVSM